MFKVSDTPIKRSWCSCTFPPISSYSSPKKSRNEFKSPSRSAFQASTLYMNEKYSDFTFICESNGESLKIPVHKCIVGSISPYFDAMFMGDNVETAEKKVTITDFSAQVMKEVFYYIYHGCISISFGPICYELVRAADYFQLDGLRDDCMDMIKENLANDNLLDSICMAAQFKRHDIVAKVKRFIELFYTDKAVEELYSDLIRNHPDTAIYYFSKT
ncbi:unnamed protein product [Bursaphelenchus xylophilus]|uniref:(pine wood nematode) hypothetical protein n=1 Tax=Bursaphelenchus xylophilus TaxID=6326 RepID=A0A1I7RHX9_BURXY|nr:unnamed protein product [Bursaphelenchus xylophilus]CAG9115295.1 unnamed protein product [Bursaphelenchus xylophilus]